jgi:hypothetical protein
LNNGKFHVYASYQILLGVIKSRRMRSAGHVAHNREMGIASGKSLRKPEGSDRSNDFSIDRIVMILNLSIYTVYKNSICTSEKWVGIV